MKDASTDTFNDALLIPFLQAAEDESERLLEAVILQEAMPIIRRVVRGAQLEGRNAESTVDDSDVEHDIVVRLIKYLHSLRENPYQKPIANFHRYVARTSKNVCNTVLRKSNPGWVSLKNKLWYFFSRHPGFALWHAANNSTGEQTTVLCGYNKWRGRERHAGAAVIPQNISQLITHGLTSSRHPITDLRRLPLEELVPHVFTHTRAPLPLNNMVNLVAELWDITRGEFTDFNSAEFSSLETTPDRQSTFATAYEDRQLLRELWIEVQRLPLAQRQALILTMRMSQGRSALALLTLTNTATLAQIATALEVSVDGLEAMSRRLPFKDADFAERLGITRQQVINLRKAARERLRRRLVANEKRHVSQRENNHYAELASR